MRARRRVVLGRLGDHAVGVTNEQQVERVLLVLGPMHTQVLEHELLVRDLEHLDLGQVEERLGRVVLIQQIISAVIIDFQIAHINLVRVRATLGDFVKNVGDGSWDNTSISISLSTSRDSVGLTGACLTIGKDCPVITFETTINHVLRDGVEYCLLLCEHVQHTIENEIMYSIFNILVACFLTVSF